MDPMMALMGQVPDESQMEMMAQMLRGRSADGGRLSTSTIEPVAKQGLFMQGQAQDVAQNMGLTRYRQKMLEAQDKDREARVLTAALASQARANKGSDKSQFHSISGSRADKIYADTEKAATVMSLGAALPREFNKSGVPLWGTIKQMAANTAPIFTDKETEQDVDTLRQWNMEYNNILRNGIFGSALTASEAAAWRAASINENMQPEQIERNTRNINAIIQHKAARKALALINEGRDPQWLYDTYSGVLPDEFWADPRGWAATANEQVRAIGEQGGGGVQELSDEELERMIREAGG